MMPQYVAYWANPSKKERRKDSVGFCEFETRAHLIDWYVQQKKATPRIKVTAFEVKNALVMEALIPSDHP